MPRRWPRLTLAALAAAIGATAAGVAPAAPTVAWDMLDVRPHDPGAFTEGLVAHDGALLESTGDCCDPARDDSSVRRVNAQTGRVDAIRWIPAPIFGEGLTVLGGSAWQLTWKDGIAYRLDPGTLRRRATVRYPREGWGLTRQGRYLVASDGSARLHWLSVPDLKTVRSVTVRDDGRPVEQLNELEMIDGLIWANVWQRDQVALIRPRDGRVAGWVDLASLRQRLGAPGEVLNGIARDPVTRQVVVTGKNWDRMFVIRLREPVPATR